MRYAVRLREGEARVLVVATGLPVSDAPTKSTRVAAWFLGGAAALALGTGAYFGVRALTSRAAGNADCPAGVCRDSSGVADDQDAKNSARAADIAFAVGATLGLAAGVLGLLGRRVDGASPAVASAPAIRITPAGIGGNL